MIVGISRLDRLQVALVWIAGTYGDVIDIQVLDPTMPPVRTAIIADRVIVRVIVDGANGGDLCAQRLTMHWLDNLHRQGIAHVPRFPFGGLMPLQVALAWLVTHPHENLAADKLTFSPETIGVLNRTTA